MRKSRKREERRKEEMAWESLDAVLFIFSMYHMCSNVSSLYLVYLLLLFSRSVVSNSL